MTELMIVMVIIIIITAMAIPMVTTIAQNLRTQGDTRDLNGAILEAKMRASANFARARLYADLSANTFHIEYYQSGATSWTSEGGVQYLSKNVAFGYGSMSSAPAGTQSTLGQAPLCLQDDLTSTYSNTACIMFNSRGIPVDSTWTPTPNDALYVTDGNSVGAVTVSVTGLSTIWRSDASATNWIKR